jgi:nitrite reductase (NADH) large subunit
VGVAYVKRCLVEDEPGRKTLQARFLRSQEVVQVDPWDERVKGVHAHEFQRLPELAGT